MDDRDKMRRWVKLAFVAALALGLFVALSIRHSIRGAAGVDDNSARTAARANRAPVAAVVAPDLSVEPVDRRQADMPMPPAPALRSHAPAAERQHPQEDGELVDARQAILDATPRALVTGKPVRWRAGDRTGYVVPSEAQEYDDRTCRNIYATTIDGEDQQEGRARRWCRPVDDDGWAPE